MPEPVLFPASRTAPVSVGVSVRYGVSARTRLPTWIVWNRGKAGQAVEVDHAPTREAAERFAQAWERASPQVAEQRGQVRSISTATTVAEVKARVLQVPLSIVPHDFRPVRPVVHQAAADEPQTIRVRTDPGDQE